MNAQIGAQFKLWLSATSLVILGAACGGVPHDRAQKSARAEERVNMTPQPSKQIAEKQTPEKQTSEKLVLSDAEWRKRLTPEQYGVLRNKDTECAFNNAFWNAHGDGTYVCAGCGQTLFDTRDKFDSGTGWPSFGKTSSAGAVETEYDGGHGMVRTEIHCSHCGGHLGHVFEDGPPPTGLRYCINSAALKFVERDPKGDGGQPREKK